MDTVKHCRVELAAAKAAYAQVSFQQSKERLYLAEDTIKAAEDDLSKAKAEVAAERAPILEEQLRQAVKARHEAALDIVPLNEAVYALKEEADRVLGHRQTVIPNLRWPEFRDEPGSKLNFWNHHFKKDGWL